MKKKLLLLLLSPFIYFPMKASPRHAAISFVNQDSVYDLGHVAKGDKIRYQFEIKNTGDTLLSITDIKCEISYLTFEWPKRPVKPNKKALIYVTCSPNEQTEIASFNTAVLITSSATQQPYPFIHISGAVTPTEGAPVINPEESHLEYKAPAPGLKPQ